jgi:chromosomal replication initiation ATPase DnaA
MSNQSAPSANNLVSFSKVGEVLKRAEYEVYCITGFKVKLKVEIPLQEMQELKTKRIYLQNIVCGFYDVDWEDVMKPTRKKHIIAARHAFIYLCFTLLQMNKSAIAFFLKLDHTTVVYVIKKINGFIEVGDEEAKTVLKIIKDLQNEFKTKEVGTASIGESTCTSVAS